MATLFARLVVADLDEFKAVHMQVEAAHKKYRVSEAVYQDVEDPRSLTVLIRGERRNIEAWLKSPERAALASKLRISSSAGTWTAEELFPDGVYRSES
jgi:hypothetical protein